MNLLLKITYDHIKLTSYSIMNVELAAQVLSSSVSNVLSNYASLDAAKNAKFCLLMVVLFDAVNIRDVTSHKFNLKSSLIMFSSIDDPRFSWLRNVFLQYFDDWLHSIEQREGNFSKNANNEMFISQQTYEALKISVNSIIEAVQFLLQQKVRCVLAERFSQDSLENYFGRQRTIGGRNHNPAARYFERNDTSIRNQKVFQPIAGNVRGVDKANIDFTDEPIPCRKK